MKICLLVLRGDVEEASDAGYYHSFTVAESGDDVSRVAAITRYLEAKDIILLNSSCFTHTTDAREESRTVRILTKTHGLDPELLKGKQWVCLAMEMGLETMVFTPAQCTTSVSLDRKGLHEASADFNWVTEASLQSILKSIALDVLKASGSGFVRVETSLKAEAEIYMEGRLCTPRAFYGEKYTTYEDVVIEEEFPGGHMAFFDMLVTSKQMRSGQDHDRNQHLAGVYDGFAPRYHAARANTGLSRMQEDLSRDYDFSGTVLDLACGNGEFGAILHEHGVSAKISGIDVSAGMTRSSYIQDHYEKPLLIGPMDEFIMASSPIS
ncbi:hypothetical protein EYZ11_005309 [Aspergillus tanneri]|uniref:Methyltransferase domain-containing protein n=1 Tax=Aspergillus tanneri TaxID=1220188 RepID=A0A4S3JIF4_9EURO|nr:hypothetical protein EYZ11_005309 [Aspergillus tanneri]